MKKLLYILLLPPLLAMECEKENKTPNGGTGYSTDTCDTTQMDSLQCELSKLPPITTTGKGTFGCLLNGKAWLSNEGDKRLQEAFSADYFEGQLAIDGIRYDGLNPIDGVSLGTINYVSKTDTTILINKQSNGRAYYSIGNFNDSSRCYYGFFNSEFNGELNILRFDSINEIVSGTFEFTTYLTKEGQDGSFENCDTIYVTNGRFDIAY